MPKKGINIYKRKDGRWEARYLKGTDKNGKKLYGSVYGKTFDEAKAKQESMLQKQPPITEILNENQYTLQTISKEWLNSIRISVKESTYQKYETAVHNHILNSYLTTKKLRDLNTKEIYQFAEQLCANGLSAKTVNDILVVLGLVLKYTEEIYNIPKPKIKYLKMQRKELRVLTNQEQAILEHFLFQDTNSYKLGILIALYTGIRIGELCALQWEDVQTDSICINKTIQRLRVGERTALSITTPKTSSSVRNIPIPSFLNEYMKSFRGRGAVVKNSYGKAVEPRLMQKTFEKYRDEQNKHSASYR